MKHMKFTKIRQFKDVVHSVKQHHDFKGIDKDIPMYQHTTPYPKLQFKGTVKLHGTNASLVFDSKGRLVNIQGRNRKLTIEKDNYGFYNSYGYFLMGQKKYDKAVIMLERQVELAPDQANPYDSLGDGYKAAGKLEKALASYKKAVEINPEFEASVKNVEELEEKLTFLTAK